MDLTIGDLLSLPSLNQGLSLAAWSVQFLAVSLVLSLGALAFRKVTGRRIPHTRLFLAAFIWLVAVKVAQIDRAGFRHEVQLSNLNSGGSRE